MVELRIPPLRERREDMPALAQRFLDEVERLDREKKRISDDALAQLVRHAWPGNVRELRNAMEQAAVLASGATLEEGDLPLSDGTSAADSQTSISARPHLGVLRSQAATVERFERNFLLRALRRTTATSLARPNRSAWCARACNRRSASSGSGRKTGEVRRRADEPLD